MGPFSIDFRERGSHARDVYSTQDTSHMETKRVKQKEEADTGLVQDSMKFKRKESGHKGEKSQTRHI